MKKESVGSEFAARLAPALRQAASIARTLEGRVAVIGIDAVFSTVRGFVVLKGTPPDRIKALEKGILKAMKHTVYQGFLKSVGLGPDSVAGSKEWNAQIKSLYKDGETTLKEMGMIK